MPTLGKVKQMLVNLMSNATKFTRPGGSVSLRIRSPNGHAFTIADTGIGIAHHDIPKALSMFGQVGRQLRAQQEGTGLGLPLTKALIESHGGTLDLHSEVEAETTVTLRFPADRVVGSTAELRAGRGS